MTFDELKRLREQYPAERFDLVFDESGRLIAVAEKPTAGVAKAVSITHQR